MSVSVNPFIPQHDHSRSRGFMGHQMKILSMYIGFYVLADFTSRILFQTESHSFLSEFLFIGIIIASVIHDVKTGPSEIGVDQLEENIMAMSQILIYLFIFIFGSACVTNQFVSPVEVEILYDDNGGDDGRGSKTLEYLWEMDYKGFDPVTVIRDVCQVVSFGYFQNASDSDYDPSKASGNVINASIHVMVDATKVAVARFLIVEGELIAKSIIQYFTNM